MRWIHHPGPHLDAYLDGELHGRDAHRVARHLARCRPCRYRLTLTRRIRRSLRTRWR